MNKSRISREFVGANEPQFEALRGRQFDDVDLMAVCLHRIQLRESIARVSGRVGDGVQRRRPGNPKR
jgi:hypothetical protein